VRVVPRRVEAQQVGAVGGAQPPHGALRREPDERRLGEREARRANRNEQEVEREARHGRDDGRAVVVEDVERRAKDERKERQDGARRGRARAARRDGELVAARREGVELREGDGR
jgi:hypothetical protein